MAKASSDQLAGDDRFAGRTSPLLHTHSYGAEQRSLPTRLYELELVFGSDGELHGYDFTPWTVLVEVPTGG